MWKPRAETQDLGKKERVGDTSYNEDTEHILEHPAFLISNFYIYSADSEELYSEGSVEKIVGGQLKGIIAGKGLIGRE